MTSNISTHAPLRRAMPGLPPCFTRRKFQLALPLRGATQVYGRHFGVYRISIRAPLAGSDDKLPWFCFPGQISIRAPLAGSDNRRRCRRLRPAYFNSRSPCGERRTIFGSRASALAFQSALPLRGATRYCVLSVSVSKFQSALPLRGATLLARYPFTMLKFQSALPLRGATVGK